MENITATTVTAAHDFNVGDFVANSWGYDQTNIDWYMIVRTTAKSVWIQEVEVRTESTSAASQVKVYPTHRPKTTSRYYVWNEEIRDSVELDEPIVEVAEIVRKAPYYCTYGEEWTLRFKFGGCRRHVGCDDGETATAQGFGH